MSPRPGFALLPDVSHELTALTERRSGLTPQLEAQLLALQGVADLLGDQIDLVLRDGLRAIGPVHDLVQQVSVQARELFASVRLGEAERARSLPERLT